MLPSGCSFSTYASYEAYAPPLQVEAQLAEHSHHIYECNAPLCRWRLSSSIYAFASYELYAPPLSSGGGSACGGCRQEDGRRGVGKEEGGKGGRCSLTLTLNLTPTPTLTLTLTPPQP